jgi:hypothetical protein
MTNKVENSDGESKASKRKAPKDGGKSATANGRIVSEHTAGVDLDAWQERRF